MVYDSLYRNNVAAKKLRGSVVEAAISRCVQVAELDLEVLAQKFSEEMEMDPDLKPVVCSTMEGAFNALDSIFQVVAQLCEHSDLARAFIRSTFLKTFSLAIDAWLTKKEFAVDPTEEDRMRGFHLMNYAHRLVERHARKFNGAYWKLSRRAYMHLLQGGFLSVLCEGLRTVPLSSPEGKHERWLCIRQFLIYLQNLCYTQPELCKPTRVELAKILGDEFWRTAAFRKTGWTDRWKSAALVVVAGCLTYSPCQSERPLPAPARACSACRSAVYCSRECQSEDWKMLHREECVSTLPNSDSYDEETRNVALFQRQETLRQQIAQVTALKAYLELRERDAHPSEARKGAFILSMDTGSPSKVCAIDQYLLLHGVDRERKLVSAYMQHRAEDTRSFLVQASTTIAGYVMENLLLVRVNNEKNFDLKARLKDLDTRADSVCTTLYQTATFVDLSTGESQHDFSD
ncbi:hypothetical protein NMY22_g2355 [Coprinellus aureogranulatus]|nr:hypothetical protein NMY22_g2355 [Coprinellus aureogranulatus]